MRRVKRVFNHRVQVVKGKTDGKEDKTAEEPDATISQAPQLEPQEECGCVTCGFDELETITEWIQCSE